MVGGAARHRRIGGHQRIKPGMEGGAELLHGLQHALVAPHPAEVVGPGRPLHGEARILRLQHRQGLGQRHRTATVTQPLPEPVLPHRLNGGVVVGANAVGLQQLQPFGAVHGNGGALPCSQAPMGLLKGRREFIHHHAAVLAVGDLAHQGRHRAPAQGLAGQPQRLVAGLHLAHQLGVGALGFDQGQDRHLLTLGVAGHQAVGQEGLLAAEGGSIGVLHAVLLHQQPAVTALPQGAHQGKQRVGVVGQVHLRRREALHPPQGLEPELGRELVLPGQQLQLEVGDGGGGGHRMAPEGAQKLHMGRERRIGGQPP